MQALKDVDLDIYPGEIHALVGENGAGKSTLIKIISAVYEKTSGTFIMDGRECEFKNVKDAKEMGISVIHQEFNLFPNLSVAENMFLDSNAKSEMVGKVSNIQWKKVYKETQDVIDRISDDISVHTDVENLNVQSQQVVEIAKALYSNARILIMDEPSAALPENEVEKMFQIMRNLRAQGVAIIYVSHRMNEIFQIADKVTVLRDGQKVGTCLVGEIDQQQLINMMIGSEIDDLYAGNKSVAADANGEVLLEVNNLEFGDGGKISFRLHKNEIISLFGLIGSGSQTVAERLFGLHTGNGEILLNGKKISVDSPGEAMGHGIGFVPGDRRRYGIVTQLPVYQNISLPVIRELSNRLVVDNDKESKHVGVMMERLRVKASSPRQLTKFLSGGNQQKVVLAKWLSIDPVLLIMVEPTRGVDIGAKAEIYELIHDMAGRGIGILLISSDIPEVIGMSDRILVMRNGKLTGEFYKSEVTQGQLLREVSKFDKQEESV